MPQSADCILQSGLESRGHIRGIQFWEEKRKRSNHDPEGIFTHSLFDPNARGLDYIAFQ
jgi:hypothetical protein